ncbi:class I SAM-dependent methyltransferase [Methanobacterium sp.]|uniref:class I SAM-dependent methyltransferase n=1 Tax=Methanobacterium sp. TaxID=2164 RepID=UPI002AB87D69|nr:class I SAM-dependent methyltransferase [Methanobacterium sp.]MDY9923867.1 class I SAM-dependent methyltransferase [Methanobacterium sp.]
MEDQMKPNREGPSKMAESIAMQRFAESSKDEDERICYDPYAIHFINPEIVEFGIKHPEEAKAKIEAMENQLPGLSSSIIARVRYFDDIVKESIGDGLQQLVILGAGYDTRSYRIEGLDEKVKVFEVDHPNTQNFKKEKIIEIFRSLPDHVTYVPIDFETQKLGQMLFENGYNESLKTLFIMEGLIMYIPPEAVDETLNFIVNKSGKDSQIIFDYYPESVVDGTTALAVGQNIRNFLIQMGEPLQFGIKEGTIGKFLSSYGFSKINDVTSTDYKKAYFNGKNKNRDVCDLLYFAQAVVE